MILCHSGFSKESARKIAEASGGRIRLNRGPTGDINWGRSITGARLNPETFTATNKHWMCKKFQETGVPAPKLLTFKQAIEYARDGKRVVGRPDYHTKSRDYWLCKTPREVTEAIRGSGSKRAATHFLEFIPSVREYRVHIFQGKSIRISEKDFNRTIVSRVRSRRNGTIDFELDYVMRKPTHPVGKIRKAAKTAVEALGLDFGAVDVLEDIDGNPYVLEVNSAPGLGGSMPRLYAEHFTNWRNHE